MIMIRFQITSLTTGGGVVAVFLTFSIWLAFFGKTGIYITENCDENLVMQCYTEPQNLRGILEV